jgi:hypothetical protein
MKAFLFILGLVAAGILGYSFEPQFRLSLTGKPPGKTPGEKPASPDPVEETPAEVPVTTPPVEPEMPADPPVEAVPDPVEEKPAAPEPAPAGSGDPVAIMKASIQSGEIKQFTFDQVLEWQPGEGSETIDGESYQTGIASYKAETIFGVKTTQAKALIQGGKVVRWLWPKSGMEIK